MARLISRQKAAELLDCNPQTVSNWVERGIIKGHIVGKFLMIDRDSIEQLFDTVKDVADTEQKLLDRKKELQGELRKVDELLEDIRGAVSEAKSTGWDRFFRLIIASAIGLDQDILSDRECKVLKAFALNQSANELAQNMGLTSERVRQIASKAMYKLEDGFNLIKILDKQKHLEQQVGEYNKRLEKLGEKASSYESRQDIAQSYLMIKRYERECSPTVKLLKKRVEDLHLSTRTKQVLLALGFKTLEDIVKKDKASLVNGHRFGKCIEELDSYITKIGLSFAMDVDSIIVTDIQEWMDRNKEGR